MHELSICQRLLRLAEDTARQHGQADIQRLTLQVGPLAGVDPDLLWQAFQVARSGTLAAQAELVIERTPLRIHCQRCGQAASATPAQLRCPHCGAMETTITSGDELLLTDISLNGSTPNV